MIPMTKSTSQLNCNYSSLEIEKIHLEQINKYDYKTMIKYFKFQESIDKLKRNKIKRIKKTNEAYKRNVSQMLFRKQETEDIRINNIKKELTKRNKIIERNKFNLQREREEELMKSKTEREMMNQSARCNFDNHFALLEEKRLLEERRTLERMQTIKDKYFKVCFERKMSYAQKRQRSFENHKRQHQIFLNKEETSLLGKEEQKFKKYYKSFWNKKERIKQAKENEKKKNEKYIKVAELKEENESNDYMRKKKIMKKISDNTLKSKLLETKRQKKREASVIEDQRKKLLILNHLFKNQKEEKIIRQGVLDYQREIVSRSVDKENSLLLKKINALESIVANQLEFEKKIPKFSKEIKQLQEESILKKDWNKRKEVYRELLRIEAEKRKKEKEELLSKQYP